MSEPLNIQFFNFFCLYCFDRLYKQFPQRISISPRMWALDALEASEESNLNQADVEDMSRFFLSAGDAIQWLCDEQFITVESRGASGDFFGVVLTSKALRALQSTPTALKENKSISSQVGEVIKGGLKKAGEDAIKMLFTAILNAGINNS